MKSLESLIEAMDNCLIDPCEDCPVYVNYKCRKDEYVTYYLKEYLKKQEVIRRKEIRLKQAIKAELEWHTEQLLNEPLDWEELKSMIGKPVWIEWYDDGCGWCRWNILIEIYKDMFGVDKLTFRNLIDSRLRLSQDDYGKNWIAYTKERKHGTFGSRCDNGEKTNNGADR